MHRVAFLLALIAAPLGAAAEPPVHVVNDTGATLSLDCADGGRVVINGGDNNVTTTGGCEKVLVNGSGNHVQVGAADKIVVTGSDNTITWGKGWTKKQPKVSTVGTGNKVAQAK